MKTPIFSLIMALLSVSLFAQLSGSDAELYDKPGEKKLLQLSANTPLYTGAADGLWLYSRVIVMVGKSDVEGDQIQAGAEIFNQKGESIGNLEHTIKLVEKKETLGRKHRDKYTAILEGYIMKTRLKENTHPEMILEEILQSKGQTTEALNDWIKTFKAKRFTKEGMIQYVIYEDEYTLEDEKSFRIILHYKDVSRLYAITTHKQKINLPKAKSQVDDEELHHYFLGNKPTESDLNTVKEIGISFLAL